MNGPIMTIRHVYYHKIAFQVFYRSFGSRLLSRSIHTSLSSLNNNTLSQSTVTNHSRRGLASDRSTTNSSSDSNVAANHSEAAATNGSARKTSSNKTSCRISAKSKAIIQRMIRVDHSGELGADRIYAGQMAVLGRTSVGPVIQHMWDQEKEHLAKFEQLIPERRARPSALVPLWTVAGYALGAGSALLGREAAMACTVAVETVITDHYNDQLRKLVTLPEYDNSPEIQSLAATISQFRDEEMEHHDTGLEHDAEQAPAYRALTGAIKVGCRAAVWVAERV